MNEVHANRLSILLVDDFEDGLEMYREYLTYRGYQVVVARNGEEAILQARVHRPDVILLDIRMPGMTGTDAMHFLRSDPSFQHVPIIALTAHALDGERVAALAAGFDELIPKPCLPDQLALAVERILSARQPNADRRLHAGGVEASGGFVKDIEAKTGHFHAVRFYQDEDSLYRIVADFVGDGLVAGQPAVVIATPIHREQIARGLQALSFDVSRLRAKGDLLMLDAEETLSTFMKDGVPDPAAFQQSVGGVLDRAIAGRPHAAVRAYGEMVDCLWKSDAAVAAIRLEVLWNQLSKTKEFSLLCGYAMGNFYKQGAYEDICDHHTHVVSGSGHPTRVGVSPVA